MARRAAKEGTIFFWAKKDLWVAKVDLGLDERGKRVRRAVYAKTQKEAREALLALQKELQEGPPLRPERITVANHFEDWLRVKKAEVRPSTWAGYEVLYRVHIRPALGRVLLRELTYQQINALYEDLDRQGLSRRTVAYVGYLLRAALEDAVRKRLIRENPARLAAKRTYRREEARFLTQEELARFREAIQGHRLENLFTLALLTGMRCGELLGLSWDAVDLEGGKLEVRQALHEDEKGRPYISTDLKTKAARRTISLGPEAIAALRRQKALQAREALAAGEKWHNTHNLVFTDSLGGPLRPTNVRRRDLAEVCRKADLEGVGFHTFRHTHASALIFQGADIKTISRRLGHENIQITLQTYGHLLPGQDEHAAELAEEFLSSLPKVPKAVKAGKGRR